MSSLQKHLINIIVISLFTLPFSSLSLDLPKLSSCLNLFKKPPTDAFKMNATIIDISQMTSSEIKRKLIQIMSSYRIIKPHSVILELEINTPHSFTREQKIEYIKLIEDTAQQFSEKSPNITDITTKVKVTNTNVAMKKFIEDITPLIEEFSKTIEHIRDEAGAEIHRARTTLKAIIDKKKHKDTVYQVLEDGINQFYDIQRNNTKTNMSEKIDKLRSMAEQLKAKIQTQESEETQSILFQTIDKALQLEIGKIEANTQVQLDSINNKHFSELLELSKLSLPSSDDMLQPQQAYAVEIGFSDNPNEQSTQKELNLVIPEFAIDLLDHYISEAILPQMTIQTISRQERESLEFLSTLTSLPTNNDKPI